MSAHLCASVQRRFLDSVFGGQAFTPPEVLWFGLSYGGSNAAGLVSEPPASAGYRRVRRPNDAFAWPGYLVVGAKANSFSVRWPRPADDWGLIRSVFIATDADVRDGEVLAMMDVSPPHGLRINANDPPLELPIGAFAWTVLPDVP